uniref:alpha-tocopherol transfer protein-like n=1 Tax=Myxine glutinosa TaxID=7769 RepID=UPI00358E5D43
MLLLLLLLLRGPPGNYLVSVTPGPCRKIWPDVFQDFRPSTIRKVIDGFLTVLPKADSEGQRIILLRHGKWNPSENSIVDNFKAMIMTLEKLIESEETQVNGIVMLADFKDIGLAQVVHFSPYFAKRIMTVTQDAFPVRIKQNNVINEPIIFKALHAIFRPFMKEKMRKRMVVHGSDMTSLHQYINPQVLPYEYGGQAGFLDTSIWKETLLSSENYFLEEFSDIELGEGENPAVVLTDEEKLMEIEFKKAIEEAGPEEEWTKF